jgi:transaldolase
MTQLDDLDEGRVSIWLDDLSRGALADGSLRRRLTSSAVVGITTNPTIFARAISAGFGYEEAIEELRRQRVGASEALRILTSQDVRRAADLLLPTFGRSAASDGFVSIEVDPALAFDAKGTIAAARLLHWHVDRPNVMVKIPATRECLPAVTASLAAGISVNVTLIFSPSRYLEVMDAAREGMQQSLDAGHDLARLRSVASFFVSRIDSAVDPLLRAQSDIAKDVEGQVGVASALASYRIYQQQAATVEWRAITAAGGLVQRPLWASTGTKDARYPDTMYVDRLVTPEAVNTMPAATLDAFMDHGAPALVSAEAIDNSEAVLSAVRNSGVNLEEVWAGLEEEGVAQFQRSWDSLTGLMASKLGSTDSNRP